MVLPSLPRGAPPSPPAPPSLAPSPAAPSPLAPSQAPAPARRLPDAFTTGPAPAAPPPWAGRRRWLLAATALPLGCALPTEPGLEGTRIDPRPPAPAPQVQPGERWRYAVLDGFSGRTRRTVDVIVASTQPTLVLRHVDVDGGHELGIEQHAGPWRVLADPAYDPVPSFDEPVPMLPPTLAPGSRANTHTRYRITGGSGRDAWSDWVAAEDWQRIDVPAGRFDCLRVRRIIRLDSPDRLRIDFVRREQLWYAPEVNRWVRRLIEGEYRTPGGRRGLPIREDRTIWVLLSHARG